MKRVFVILFLLSFLQISSFAQITPKRNIYKTTVELSYKGDTVIINDFSKVHFVRIGAKTYKIVIPEPYMEEVKPFFILGSGLLIDSLYPSKTMLLFNNNFHAL